MAIADYVPPITQLQQELDMWRSKAYQNEENLRDRFAMAALTALIPIGIAHNTGRDSSVCEAYSYADSMMACRKESAKGEATND